MLAGAAGVFALSMVAVTTPFPVTAVGFLLCGAGFGLLVPGVTHVAMRDVPPEISGAASAVVNVSRQIGTSVGLAVLGTLGVTSAIESWQATAQRFPAAIRAEALRQAQNVGGARINAVSEPSAPPTGSRPPSHSRTATTLPSKPAQPACSPPPSSPSSGSGSRPPERRGM